MNTILDLFLYFDVVVHVFSSVHNNVRVTWLTHWKIVDVIESCVERMGSVTDAVAGGLCSQIIR